MLLLIIGLPLISGIFCGIGNKILSFKLATFIAASSILVSAILSLQLLFYIQLENKILHEIVAYWFSIGSCKINWSIYVDHLTAVMFTIVTIVSAIVHIYSYGYMHDDENLPRFMSYLSLFTFCMLVLVSADNFVQLFLGWEGVGLCSYLLIGFWYKKDSATTAAIKAFVVNRIGDFAFIIGILSIIYFVGSVNFDIVFQSTELLTAAYLNIGNTEVPVIEIIAMFLFIGCMGKSAQIGLHVWLPDAMEGPTPVSALIHAATMVTAGVFLLARASPLFEHAPFTSHVILYIGAITCIFAASVAIAQNDIKKIIAYSTCSQLGYMFMACGALAYKAGIFHLVTHAFFKAMLFLCAGIVIHAVHEQDITKMGGLRKYMPVTYILFWIGSFAIMGIYPFAGYYSKDMILESVFNAHANIAFLLGLCAAFLTAIYSMKIIVTVFHGESHSESHAHDGPMVMVLPLLLLAVASVGGGMFLVNYFETGHSHNEIPAEIKYAPLIVGVSGMLVGLTIYQFKISEKLVKIFGFIYRILANKYYFDELYKAVFGRINNLLTIGAKYIDGIIDIFPDTTADIAHISGLMVSKTQDGYIFSYAFYVLLGLLSVMFWWLMGLYF